jgi:hypothetical protein
MLQGKQFVILLTLSLFSYVLNDKNVIPISSTLHLLHSWQRLREACTNITRDKTVFITSDAICILSNTESHLSFV